jgi:hypothetical protein
MNVSIRSATVCAALMLAPVPAAAQQVFGLVDSSRIVTFNASNPTAITSSSTITGLPAGVVLTGIDVRPADNQLYAVSTAGNVYQLTASGGTYTATSTGITSTTPSGSSFGFDFNPTVDRLRLVSDTNQNLRINTSAPTGAGTIVDTPATLNGTADIDLVGAAYTNSFFGASTTTLYGIDAFTDALVRATNANAGTYVSVGSLGLTLSSTDRVGFDISGASGAAFLSLNDILFGVDLNTGAATRIGAVGATGLTGLAVAAVPEPGTWALMLLGFGAVGFAMRRRRAGALQPV